MDAKEDEDSISEINLHAKSVYGKTKSLPELNKMNSVIIRIRNSNNVRESKNSLISMLEDLMSIEEKNIKKQKLINKYNMIMTEKVERRIEIMCNLSTVIEERGIEKGINGLISGMREIGQSDDSIIKMIMKQFSLSKNDAEKYVKQSWL